MTSKKLTASSFLRQFTAATSASLTTLCYGCCMGWPSSSILKLKSNDPGIIMSDEEISWMVAAIEVGTLVSPLPAGFFLNRQGRKKTIICAGALYFLSWVLIAVANNPWYLYTARFVAGLGKGVTFTALPIYLGEIASVSIRGASVVLMTTTNWSGNILVHAVGPFLSFKMLAIFLGIYPLILVFTFIFMPESPYYLLMKGQNNEACKSLMWLRGSSEKGVENEFQEMKKCISEDLKSKGRVVDLFKASESRRALFITFSLLIMHRFWGSTSLAAYSSTTLPLIQELSSFGTMLIFDGISLVSFLMIAPLVDYLGRRPIMMWAAAGTGVLSGVSAVFYFLYKKTTLDMTSLLSLPYICLFLLSVTHTSLGAMAETLQGELFTTNLRGHATALCTLVMAVCSFVVEKLYVTVSINIGVYANFVVYSLSGILCTVFVYIFVFETKGKSFLEIQYMLRHQKNKLCC